MIKVLFDISPTKSAHQYRGVGFYTKRLSDSLKELSGKGAYQDIKVEELDFFKKCYQLPARNATHSVAGGPATSYQLLHIPYFDPFFLTLPLLRRIPMVVTVHDLIPIKYAKHFPKGIKGSLKWLVQKSLLRKATAIITDSKFWQRQISPIIDYPAKNIYAVHLASGEQFKIIKDISFLRKVRKKYQLPKKFVLYVGDLNWNKNVPGLLSAIKNVEDIKLVLVGKAFLEENPVSLEINDLIQRLKLNNRIIKLGFVPTEDLVAIYNLASVYCQPSFAEGFGLPVLEAMSCGCPVVCSNSSSLPEIVGKAGILVDPRNAKEVAKAINKLAFGVSIHQRMREEGLACAKRFSWEKTAKETLEVYKKVIEAQNAKRKS